ncbi:DUF6783 domain-containing protein [Blautia glucerasea]
MYRKAGVQIAGMIFQTGSKAVHRGAVTGHGVNSNLLFCTL